MQELAEECFTQQCEQVKNEFWNQDLANEYTAELQKIEANAAITLKELQEAEVKADDELALAQANYDTVLDEFKAGSEAAQKAYDDCIAKCAGDPACEADCLADRDATIAKLQADLDAAAENLADAQAAYDAAVAATAAAAEAYEEAQEAVVEQDNRVDQIQALCGGGLS